LRENLQLEGEKKMKNTNIISGILVLAVLLIVGLGCERKSSFTYNGSELEYKNVTSAEARQLLDYLIEVKYFNDRPKTAQLDKSGSTYQFRAVIKTKARNDQAFHEDVKLFAEELSANVFNDAPVEIHICDENFETIHVVKP